MDNLLITVIIILMVFLCLICLFTVLIMLRDIIREITLGRKGKKDEKLIESSPVAAEKAETTPETEGNTK